MANRGGKKKEKYAKQIIRSRDNKLRKIARQVNKNPNDKVAAMCLDIVKKTKPGDRTKGICK